MRQIFGNICHYAFVYWSLQKCKLRLRNFKSGPCYLFPCMLYLQVFKFPIKNWRINKLLGLTTTIIESSRIRTIRDCLSKHSIFFWAVISPPKDHDFLGIHVCVRFASSVMSRLRWKISYIANRCLLDHEAVETRVAREIIITIQLSSLSRQ